MSRKLCKSPAKRDMLRFRANHYIEAVEGKLKTHGVRPQKDKRIIPRRRMILFLSAMRSPEGATLRRIVKAEPYARCRSKAPPECRGRASPGCKGSVLPGCRGRAMPDPRQRLVGSRMKCRVRRGETSSGQGRSALVRPGRQPWPSCLSMRQTVLGIT